MWKKISYLCILLFIMCFCLNFNVNAGNEITNEPYDTKVMGLEGKLVTSSMAYEAINVLNLGFSKPEDLYIADNGNVYVADSEQKVVYVYNPKTNSTTLIGEGILESPKGICLDFKGNLYVADSINKVIYVFDQNGKQVGEPIGEPKEPLYGNRDELDFTPLKVSVDRGGNIYVVTQSNQNGIVQMNKDGKFISYFGRNATKNTLEIRIKRLFIPKEERDIKVPPYNEEIIKNIPDDFFAKEHKTSKIVDNCFIEFINFENGKVKLTNNLADPEVDWAHVKAEGWENFRLEDGYVTATEVVPEPAEWAMIFGTIALAFVVYRRRR